MKIFDITPDGNEMAEMSNAKYINLALKNIEEHTEWLKTSQKPAQALLAHIDILLMFARKFPVNSNLLIKKDRVQEWKSVFYAWYDRANKKIPAKFREGIKLNADNLFEELNTYGH